MKMVLLLICAVLWFLHSVGVHSENFSLVWMGAALIPAALALEGTGLPWVKK